MATLTRQAHGRGLTSKSDIDVFLAVDHLSNRAAVEVSEVVDNSNHKGEYSCQEGQGSRASSISQPCKYIDI